MELTKSELMNVYGGISIIKWGSIAIVAGSILSFVVGIIDGYIRPLSCNK